MQPLPSGLPPTIPLPPLPQTSTPPPPPPPPRLPIAAFTSAAANASLLPQSRRRPTLHIIVVLGSAIEPILRHAHHALCTLSAKGVHVFLQTETERIGTRTVTPITPDVVPDVITACRADFIVLIADRNVPSCTVRVRLSPTTDFKDVPLSDLSDTVLAAWTQQVRAVPDRLQQVSLAFNPNVVTTAHLDLLLQSYSRISAIRRSYAKLARLVNITQDWVRTSSTAISQNVDTKAKPEKHIKTLDKFPIQLGPATDCEQPSRAVESEENMSPVDTHDTHDTLALKALRDGLRRIARANNSRDKQSKGEGQSSKQDITFCWLKRSESMSARLLRSHLLACDVHHKLVNSFDVILTLPVAPSPLTPFDGVHLPTEAHRQRLLREINDMLPRIEELGHRLSKRPRTQRRRRQFHAANPWMSYVIQAETQTENNGIAAWTGRLQHAWQETFWRCFACRTLNELQLHICKTCQTGNHALNRASRPANSEVFRKRLRESMKNANGVPSPWIFAPGAMPLQPPLNTGPLNGLASQDQSKLDTPANAYLTEHIVRHGVKDSPFGSPPLHEVHKAQLRQFELGSAIQALSFGDEDNGFAVDAELTSKRPMEHRNLYRMSPARANRTRRSPSLSASDATVSPVRFASSAPNGRTPLEFTSQRLPNGIRSTTSPQMAISQQRAAQSSHHMNASTNLDSNKAGPPSMIVGSFPGSSVFSGNLSYEVGPIKRQSEANPRDLMPLNDIPSGGIGRDQIVTPSKSGLSSAMEELALGSYEAVEPRNRLTGSTRRAVTHPVAVPGFTAREEIQKSEITSLEALAAASDAANGGTGSATQESLRAVSAVVTPNRGHSGQHSRSKGIPNGTYNMF